MGGGGVGECSKVASWSLEKHGPEGVGAAEVMLVGVVVVG